MSILTRIGKLIGKNTIPKGSAPFAVRGDHGAQVYGGYLTSNEQNADLAGRTRYLTFSETIANVSIVSAGIRYVLNLGAKPSWEAIPANESEEAVEYANKLMAALGDMTTPFYRVVRKTLLYRFLGFSIQEWTAKRREDGSIGFLDIMPRSQSQIVRWDIDDATGDILGVWQENVRTGRETYIPRWKFIYCVDDALNDSPEGLGLMRHVIGDAKRLCRYEQLEGFGFETDLRGVPVVRAPLAELRRQVNAGGLTDDDVTALLAPAKDFLENHVRAPDQGFLMDSDVYTDRGEDQKPSGTPMWSLELLEAGISGQTAVAAAINRKVHDIARVLGVDHLMLGAGPNGTRSLGESKNQNVSLIIDSSLKEIAECYSKDIVDPLWVMNAWPVDLKPTLQPATVQYRSLDELSTFIHNVAASGVPLDVNDEVVRELFAEAGLSAPNVETRELDAMTPVIPGERKFPNADELTPDPEDPDPEE